MYKHNQVNFLQKKTRCTIATTRKPRLQLRNSSSTTQTSIYTSTNFTSSSLTAQSKRCNHSSLNRTRGNFGNQEPSSVFCALWQALFCTGRHSFFLPLGSCQLLLPKTSFLFFILLFFWWKCPLPLCILPDV